MNNDIHPETTSDDVLNSKSESIENASQPPIYDGLYLLAFIFSAINAACAVFGLKSYIAAAACAFVFAKLNGERLKCESLLRVYYGERFKIFVRLYLSVFIVGLSSIAWPLSLGEKINITETLARSLVYSPFEVFALFGTLMFAGYMVMPNSIELENILISRYAYSLFCVRSIPTPEEKPMAREKMSRLSNTVHYMLDDLFTLLMLTFLVFIWVWLGAPSADRMMSRALFP